MSTISRFSLSWQLPLVLLVIFHYSSTSTLIWYLVILPLVLLGLVLVVIGGLLWATWSGERREKRRQSGGQSERKGEGGGRGGTASYRPGVPPSFHFTSPAAWSMTQTKASWESSNRPSLFPDAPPFLSAAIEELLSLISRDFILKWYSSISDSPAFPNAVKQTIAETLISLSTRVSEVDWSDVLVGRILPLLTTHLDTFRAAEQALRRQDLRADLSESDELDLFLASRYSSQLKSGKLHQAVDMASTNSRPAEEAWLRSLFGRILPLILPEREVESPAVAIMVREIVSCAVMVPVFDMLGDPDFWNRIIDDKVRFAASFSLDSRD